MRNEEVPHEVLSTDYCLACKTIFTRFCYFAPNHVKSIVAARSHKITSFVNFLTKYFCDFATVALELITNVWKRPTTSQHTVHGQENTLVPLTDPKATYCYFYTNPRQPVFVNTFIYLVNQKYRIRRDAGTESNISIYICTVYLQGEICCTNQQNVPELSGTETTEPSPRSIPTINSSSSSTLSVTSKLSGTGSVLSNWIPWSKKKKGGTDQVQKNSSHSSSASEHSVEENPNCETQTLGEIPARKCSSKSKIPLRKPTATLENSIVPSEDSQVLLDKCNHKSPWFFRKLKSKPGQQSVSTESSAGDFPSFERMAETSQPQQERSPSLVRTNSNGSLRSGNGCNSPRETFSMKSCSSYDATQARSVICASSQYLLEPNLVDSLREVIELSTRLHESEVHVTRVISKYVLDHSLEKELLNLVSNHTKIHLEAERRAQTLASEIWIQQSDMMKTQEREMRENIKVLVRENRKLQEDLEILTKRNEKLNIKVSQFPERHKLCDSSSQVLENLSRNNDRLRYKVTTMTVQVEDQEKELNRMRRKSESLEQLLRNANSQLQNSKVMLQRTQTDHELEYSRLSHQLQADEAIIKESIEAGDILLEDLDGLKRQLKTMPCSLNWTKLKSRGNSLPDLIYMCRSCINELAKELQHAQTDMVIKEKDKDILREELARVDKCLEASKSNEERQSDQLEALKNQKEEFHKYYSKCNDLEDQLSKYRNKLEGMEQDLKKEKSSLTAAISDTDTLKRKVIEKDEELSLTKEKMSEYKSENDALRMQLHGLKQVLAASGSGDVARELADTQEKMTFFQSQYYQLMSEKNYLMEQVQSANVERTALSEFQNNCYEFVQGQQRDLETLCKENKEMKQQLEAERNRSSVLHLERNKLKEEKNIMRKIYHQLKSEINRVQQLEGEMVGMNLEANRLAIIAEYNQQLGEKLQCEVAEREIRISELRSNMEELNMAQMENVKDKVALCVELSEVCNINDKLKDSLVTEQQKSVHLDNTKKKIEDAATTQLRTVEEMQMAERAALRDLLRDYKIVVRQRDNLLASQNEYLQQISDLRTNAILQAKTIESTMCELTQSQKINTSLEKKMKELKEQLMKVDGELATYNNYKAHNQVEMGKLKEQVEALEASKKYLQNTLQKVHSDLNESMRSEVETKLLLEKQTQKMSSMQSALDQNLEALTEATEQNQNMMEQISTFNEAYEELLEKCKRGMAHAESLNEQLKKDLDETKSLVETRSEEITRLKNAYAEKELDIIEMQQYTNSLCEQLEQMESSVEDIDLQSRLLSESNAKQARIQEALAIVRLEHDQCPDIISSLRHDNTDLQQKLQFQMEKYDLHSSHYKKYMEDTIKDYTDQKRLMESDMHNLLEKYHDLQKEYEDHKNLHTILCESHKDLAGKLLKAVRMLINEKLGRQGAEASVSSLSHKNIRLFSEKAAAESISILLSNELTALKNKFEELTADRMSIQAILGDLQELQRQAQAEFRNSELIQIHNIEDSYGSTGILLVEARNKLEDIAVQEQSKELQDELSDSHTKIMELTIQISNLKQELTIMEFKKSEVVLRLHETEAQLKVEQNINKELMETNQRLLGEVLAMAQDGSITRPVSEILVNLVQGQAFNDFMPE